MAGAAAAALLDALMGRNRNNGPNEKRIDLNWEDPEYCKYYLVKFCPHDLFVNTRADLGTCPKTHDDEIKKLFEASSSHKKVKYIEDFIRCCKSILNDVERRIEKGKKRLLLMNSTGYSFPVEKNTRHIAELSEKINNLVNEAEAAGYEGNVEEAQKLMKLCDKLEEERRTLRQENDNYISYQAMEQDEKQMKVCEVCGAFLIVGDAQQRVDDHLTGKQHVGYTKLKTALHEMVEVRDNILEERNRHYHKEGSTSSKDSRHREEKHQERRERKDRRNSGYTKERRREHDRSDHHNRGKERRRRK